MLENCLRHNVNTTWQKNHLYKTEKDDIFLTMDALVFFKTPKQNKFVYHLKLVIWKEIKQVF